MPFAIPHRKHGHVAGRLCRQLPGFTLLEVIVVLVIIGILTALVTPRFSGLVDRATVSSVANRFRSDISYTRTIAIRQGLRYQLRYTHVDVGGRSCIVEYHIRPQQGDDVPIRRVHIPEAYRGLCLSAQGNQLTFDSRGLATSGRTFIVERGGFRKRLIMNRIGRVRLEG